MQQQHHPERLTPGCPSETGTYFAVIKSYVNDELEKCVLHYQKHKGLLRAVGHSFNCEVKEEDVVGYVGHPNEEPVWVKCYDRLPGYETPVLWRDGKDHSHVTDGKIPLINMAKPFLTDWEWLDESLSKEGNMLTQERADFIRESNGRDLNGIGNKEREVAFAEWCINNHGWEFEPYSEEYRWMKGDIYYTTEQLYEQYNQQKEGMK